jgi:hypothetical protein
VVHRDINSRAFPTGFPDPASSRRADFAARTWARRRAELWAWCSRYRIWAWAKSWPGAVSCPIPRVSPTLLLIPRSVGKVLVTLFIGAPSQVSPATSWNVTD